MLPSLTQMFPQGYRIVLFPYTEASMHGCSAKIGVPDKYVKSSKNTCYLDIFSRDKSHRSATLPK